MSICHNVFLLFRDVVLKGKMEKQREGSDEKESGKQMRRVLDNFHPVFLCFSPCLSVSLSLSLSPRPLPLPLSLPPSSGIYTSYCDWIDCTWEVYLTTQLKVQLVRLDERAWEQLSYSVSSLHKELVFSLYTNLKKKHFSIPHSKFWHIQG